MINLKEEMIKESWFIGVDPGTSKASHLCGQVCFLNEEWNSIVFIPAYDYQEVRSALKLLRGNILFAVVEGVPYHFGAPHGDSERFKERFEMYKIPYAAPAPNSWQTFLGEHKKKEKKGSIEFVKARFPQFVEYIKAPRGGFNSNKADALVLAVYAEQYIRAKK